MIFPGSCSWTTYQWVQDEFKIHFLVSHPIYRTLYTKLPLIPIVFVLWAFGLVNGSGSYSKLGLGSCGN